MKYTELIQKLIDSELGKTPNSKIDDISLIKLVMHQNRKFHAFAPTELIRIAQIAATSQIPAMQLHAKDGLYDILQKIRSIKEQIAKENLHHNHSLALTILHKLPTFIFTGIASLNLRYKKLSDLISQLSALEAKLHDQIIKIEAACLIAYGKEKRRMIASNPLLLSMLGNILKQEDIDEFYLEYSKNLRQPKDILTAIILKNLQQIALQIDSELGIKDDIPDALINEIHIKYASIFALELLPLLNNAPADAKCKRIYSVLPQQINSYKQACVTYYSKRLISDITSSIFNNLRLIAGWINPNTETATAATLEIIILKSLQEIDSRVPKFTHAVKNILQTITNDNIIGSFWKSLHPIIKDMFSLMFSPWVEYYTALANRENLLQLRNQYTYFEKIKFFIKFTLPIIATFISYIYLAPMYNDFLVLVVAPLFVSLVIVLIREIFKILSNVWDFILRRKEYATNPRVEVIFGKSNAALVAKFYELLVKTTDKELQALNKKSIPVKTTHDEQEFQTLKKTLEALKKEWHMISHDELAHRNITDQDARDIFICRVITTTNNATQKFAHEVETIVEQVIQSVLNNDRPVSLVTSDQTVASQSSATKPLTRLFELRTTSTEKSNHYCGMTHAIATKTEIPADVAEGLKLTK